MSPAWGAGDNRNVGELAAGTVTMRISGQELAMMEALLAPARSTVTAEAWDAGLSAGRALGRPKATALISAALHDEPGL